MIDALQASGELRAGDAARPIGRVQTGDRGPGIGAAAGDRQRRVAQGRPPRCDQRVYFPDATLSTAGAHVAAILERLGIRDALASRLRMFANGATAMRELAGADERADRLHAGDRDPLHAGPGAGRCAAGAVRARHRLQRRRRRTRRATMKRALRFIDGSPVERRAARRRRLRRRSTRRDASRRLSGRRPRVDALVQRPVAAADAEAAGAGERDRDGGEQEHRLQARARSRPARPA